MGRFGNSWRVFKQSLEVLKHDKELLILPIISGIASLLVVASFIFPMYATGLIERAIEPITPEDEQAQYVVLGVFFLVYLILSFITVYFNGGIVYAANMRMDGKNPTLKDALRGPSRHLGQIFLWSIFIATVALLIRAIEAFLRDRAGPLVASIFGFLAGAAWWMATYFAVPVVVLEGKHVGPALKRSTGLFKQRWGESLIGHFGLGIAIFMLNLIGVVFIIAGLAVGAQTGLIPLAIGVAAIGLLWMLFVNVALGPALNAIYKTALYRYATKGEVVPYFSPESITQSWTPKGGGGATGAGWQRV